MTSRHPESRFRTATLDQLVSALSNEDDRRVLNYFQESSEDVASLDELAEYVARRKTGGDPRSPERIALHLHHIGLPKLADTGLLDYDPRSKTVRCWNHRVLEDEAFGKLLEGG